MQSNSRTTRFGTSASHQQRNSGGAPPPPPPPPPPSSQQQQQQQLPLDGYPIHQFTFVEPTPPSAAQDPDDLSGFFQAPELSQNNHGNLGGLGGGSSNSSISIDLSRLSTTATAAAGPAGKGTPIAPVVINRGQQPPLPPPPPPSGTSLGKAQGPPKQEKKVPLPPPQLTASLLERYPKEVQELFLGKRGAQHLKVAAAVPKTSVPSLSNHHGAINSNSNQQRQESLIDVDAADNDNDEVPPPQGNDGSRLLPFGGEPSALFFHKSQQQRDACIDVLVETQEFITQEMVPHSNAVMKICDEVAGGSGGGGQNPSSSTTTTAGAGDHGAVDSILNQDFSFPPDPPELKGLQLRAYKLNQLQQCVQRLKQVDKFYASFGEQVLPNGNPATANPWTAESQMSNTPTEAASTPLASLPIPEMKIPSSSSFAGKRAKLFSPQAVANFKDQVENAKMAMNLFFDTLLESYEEHQEAAVFLLGDVEARQRNTQQLVDATRARLINQERSVFVNFSVGMSRFIQGKQKALAAKEQEAKHVSPYDEKSSSIQKEIGALKKEIEIAKEDLIKGRDKHCSISRAAGRGGYQETLDSIMSHEEQEALNAVIDTLQEGVVVPPHSSDNTIIIGSGEATDAAGGVVIEEDREVQVTGSWRPPMKNLQQDEGQEKKQRDGSAAGSSSILGWLFGGSSSGKEEQEQQKHNPAPRLQQESQQQQSSSTSLQPVVGKYKPKSGKTKQQDVGQPPASTTSTNVVADPSHHRNSNSNANPVTNFADNLNKGEEEEEPDDIVREGYEEDGAEYQRKKQGWLGGMVSRLVGKKSDAASHRGFAGGSGAGGGGNLPIMFDQEPCEQPEMSEIVKEGGAEEESTNNSASAGHRTTGSDGAQATGPEEDDDGRQSKRRRTEDN